MADVEKLAGTRPAHTNGSDHTLEGNLTGTTAGNSHLAHRAVTPGGHPVDTSQPAFPVYHRRLANPAPLGLLAFATTTFVLSWYNTGVRDITVRLTSRPLRLAPDADLFLSLCTVSAPERCRRPRPRFWRSRAAPGRHVGGQSSSLSRLLLCPPPSLTVPLSYVQFACGNTFGATAFTAYGAFWISYATIQWPSSGILSASWAPGELESSLGIYLMAWFVFT
jgi:hypothetical protein